MKNNLRSEFSCLCGCEDPGRGAARSLYVPFMRPVCVQAYQKSPSLHPFFRRRRIHGKAATQNDPECNCEPSGIVRAMRIRTCRRSVTGAFPLECAAVPTCVFPSMKIHKSVPFLPEAHVPELPITCLYYNTNPRVGQGRFYNPW